MSTYDDLNRIADRLNEGASGVEQQAFAVELRAIADARKPKAEKPEVAEEPKAEPKKAKK